MVHNIWTGSDNNGEIVSAGKHQHLKFLTQHNPSISGWKMPLLVIEFPCPRIDTWTHPVAIATTLFRQVHEFTSAASCCSLIDLLITFHFSQCSFIEKIVNKCNIAPKLHVLSEQLIKKSLENNALMHRNFVQSHLKISNAIEIKHNFNTIGCPQQLQWRNWLDNIVFRQCLTSTSKSLIVWWKPMKKSISSAANLKKIDSEWICGRIFRDNRTWPLFVVQQWKLGAPKSACSQEKKKLWVICSKFLNFHSLLQSIFPMAHEQESKRQIEKIAH